MSRSCRPSQAGSVQRLAWIFHGYLQHLTAVSGRSLKVHEPGLDMEGAHTESGRLHDVRKMGGVLAFTKRLALIGWTALV